MLSILTAGACFSRVARREQQHQQAFSGTFIINATVFPIVATAVSSLPMPLSFRSVSSVTDGTISELRQTAAVFVGVSKVVRVGAD
jgi:hypothetical protein